MISLKHALAAEPRPRYRWTTALPDYSQRLRRRSGCSGACLEARLRRWRESDDPTAPAHFRRVLEPAARVQWPGTPDADD